MDFFDKEDALAPRPELTSRQNVGEGRHGWLRLTPAYSVHLVEQILKQHLKTAHVLDPFGGTGTTVLCAAQRGHPAASIEINPFLAWLARAKVARYSAEALQEASAAAEVISARLKRSQGPLAPEPAIHDLERWWAPKQLEHLRRIKGSIDSLQLGRQAKDLLTVAFCRVVIETANVTRRHQSLSFSDKQLEFAFGADNFNQSVGLVLTSALRNPARAADIFLGDARVLAPIKPRSVDVVITSPPYPNRLTAVRELRPYLYWLNFFQSPSDGGELDWNAIGGTWGAATHRLKYWSPAEGLYVPTVVKSVCRRIGKEDSANALIMTNYVRRYFEDISIHLTDIKRVMRRGGRIYYVIGNSSFYGHIVEAEKAYVDLLQHLGFRNPEAHTLRKRSSKSELFEFLVTADAR